MKQIEKMLQSIDGEVKALYPSKPNVKSTDDSDYPSVRLLTYTLRNQGYSPEEAVLDITDNAIDACDNNGTKSPRIFIDVNIKSQTPYLCVADNGGGFGDMKTLHEAIRLGSDIKSIEEGTLGCYGVGMKLSAFSMGKRLTIITKIEKSTVTAILDLDYANLLKSWKFKITRESTIEEETLLTQLASDTIILVDKFDKIKNYSKIEFANKLKKSFGEIYYYKLRQNFTMFINGEAIKLHDPMLRDLKRTKLLNYADKETNYMFNIGDSEILLKFYHTAVIPKGSDKMRVTNIQNQGIYVYRNGRQIMRADTLGMFNKHNNLNCFRVELHFHSELDDLFHTPSTKTSIKITDDALYKKIHDMLSIYTSQSKNLYEDKNKENSNGDVVKKDETDIKFENSVNKSPTAPIMNADQYKEEEEKRKRKRGEKPESPKEEKKKKRGRRAYHKKRIEIDYSNGMSKNDPFFFPEPIGQQKWKITYNANHPFVQEMKTLSEIGQFMIHNLVYTVILASYEKLYNTTNIKSDEKGQLIDLFLEEWSLKLRDMVEIFK